MRLTISLASRGRPEILRRTLEQTVQNLRESGTRIVVALDADDETCSGFVFDHPNVVVSVEPREESIGDKWNRAVRVAPADAYMLMGDYTPHATPGFDSETLKAASLFPDGIGLVVNHMANMSFAGMYVATAGLVERMGYLCPPYFPYWFVDHWLDDIGRMIGRVAFADVNFGPYKKPPTQGMREPAFWAMVYDALVFERREIAERIIRSDDFLEPGWRKSMLLGAARLVEERSFMVNGYVRTIPASDRTTDARYERIKARAMLKLAEVAQFIEKEAA